MADSDERSSGIDPFDHRLEALTIRGFFDAVQIAGNIVVISCMCKYGTSILPCNIWKTGVHFEENFPFEALIESGLNADNAIRRSRRPPLRPGKLLKFDGAFHLHATIDLGRGTEGYENVCYKPFTPRDQ